MSPGDTASGQRAYRVIWTQPALDDLLGIVDYIAADSPQRATGVLNRLEATAASLRLLPLRGRIVPELYAEGLSNIRELIRRPWRIVYDIDGRSVTVIGVFDGRRRLASVLLQRILHP